MTPTALRLGIAAAAISISAAGIGHYVDNYVTKKRARRELLAAITEGVEVKSFDIAICDIEFLATVVQQIGHTVTRDLNLRASTGVPTEHGLNCVKNLYHVGDALGLILRTKCTLNHAGRAYLRGLLILLVGIGTRIQTAQRLAGGESHDLTVALKDVQAVVSVVEDIRTRFA